MMDNTQKTADRAALERILAMIRTHGGEDPGANYQLLCAVQRIARTALGAK